MNSGRVFLVGAGPGDEGLITVKGLEAIKQADVILYDRLVNMKLVESVPAHCELIYCGKLPHRHTLRQEEINALLVSEALEGKTVVRLKGGDPGVFGRVGEEAEELAKHGIDFDIIPGITSGIAASLYAGVPITHRDYGVSFAIVSAHDKTREMDWAGLVSSVDTLAFYMGVSNIDSITENLIKAKKPVDTPVMLVRWGTYGRQEVLMGTLATITNKVAEAGFTNPAITLVGQVVALREKLKWFEQKPLYGKQILLSRTSTGPSTLANELIKLGADVIEFPKWRKNTFIANRNIVAKIEEFECILFTSPESVDDFIQLFINHSIDIRRWRADLFGLSTKSVKALKQRGLLGHLEAKMPLTNKLLIVGDQTILDKQEQFKGKYHHFELFQTSEKIIDEKFIFLKKQMFDEANINTVIFPSASSVEVLIKQGTNYEINVKNVLSTANIYCMGPNSEKEVEKHGYRVSGTTTEPSTKALIACLMNEMK